MIRRIVGAGLAVSVAVAIGGSGAARAQPAPGGRCQAVLQSLSRLKTDPGGVAEDGPDGCRFTGVEVAIGPSAAYRAETVVEHGIPAVLQVPTQLAEMRVEARGIRFVVHTGSAQTDWLARQQQDPFDVVLGLAFDPAMSQLDLRELTVTGRSLGRVSATALLSGVSERDAPQRAGLRVLDLHMDSRRFIPAFVLSLLAPLLPSDDPGAAVEAAKVRAAATARALLPQAGATPETVAAVTGFIADFPHPQHVLDLQVRADPGLSMDAASAASTDPAALTALLKTVRVRADYAGDAR